MNAGVPIRTARQKSGMTLRQLGAAAGTSHATLSAYETGSKTPNVATLTRVLDAAGFAVDVKLQRRNGRSGALDKGEELAAVLELAAAFPARHERRLTAPVFGRSSPSTSGAMTNASNTYAD